VTLNVSTRAKAAAFLAGRLPDVRGRDRIIHTLIHGHEGSGTGTIRNQDGQAFHVSLPEESHVWMLIRQSLALAPIFRAAVPRGSTVIDVGANLGLYTCLAADLVGPTGRVISFEPNPAVFQRLEANVELNEFGGRVTTVCAAVGAQPGSTQLWIPEISHGLASLGEIPGSKVVDVTITTVDDHAPATPPALMKVDVEGFELGVLQGAQRMLSDANGPGRRPQNSSPCCGRTVTTSTTPLPTVSPRLMGTEAT
jgi:FkbM family methyltransferase